MNNLTNFIKEHKNWKELLSNPPYNLIIKDDPDYPNLYLFKYNQYESDMNEIICQEARGIILEILDNKISIVCHSFDKFFNYSESQGQQLLEKFNWDKYSFQEKRDGSLMRLWWYHGKRMISTSGTIDAYKASVDHPNCPYKTFGEMFDHILDSYHEECLIKPDVLKKIMTYSFEMTSPGNRIVVDYDKDELTLIGVRINGMNIELDPDFINPFKSIKTPKKYYFKDIKSALDVINKMSNFEGLVLCDDKFNRVKIKTDEYLLIASAYDQVGSDRGVLRLILSGKADDIKGLIPQLSYRIDNVENYLKTEINNINSLFNSVDFTQDRKSLALQIKGSPYSSFVFKKYNNPDYNPSTDYFILDNLEKIYKDYKERSKEVN